jgi:DNA-binding PadR family transcriptional regulator
MSGYSLILCIYKKFGVKLSAGTVYCLLRSLEKKRLLEVHSKKTRRYTLSKKGERTLRIIGNMQTRIKALNQEILKVLSLFKLTRGKALSSLLG